MVPSTTTQKATRPFRNYFLQEMTMGKIVKFTLSRANYNLQLTFISQTRIFKNVGLIVTVIQLQVPIPENYS